MHDVALQDKSSACVPSGFLHAWPGCTRRLLCETMVLYTALSMPRVRVAAVALRQWGSMLAP